MGISVFYQVGSAAMDPANPSDRSWRTAKAGSIILATFLAREEVSLP
jgi:hypothetical protein